MSKTKNTGFTLIEIMLSVATIAALTGMSVPVYQNFQVRNDVHIAADVIAQSLRRAQVLSQSMEGDSQWGVTIVNGSITLFKGTSFVSRDTDFDESFEFASSMAHSGLQEVIFSKMEGLPLSQGSMTVSTNTGVTRTLSINSKGILEY